MDVMENPFSPGAGSPPPELVGRDTLLERSRISLHRLRKGRPAKSQILVGLRGVGKTVLLNRMHEAAGREGFRSLLLEAHEGKPLPQVLIPQIRQLLFSLDTGANVNEKVKRGFRVLRSFAGVLKTKARLGELELELGVEPERGAADSGDLELDLSELLVALGEAAVERETAILLCIDELQYLSEVELSSLIMALHRTSQRNLPVALVGAGLPQVVGLAGKSKSYAERLFDYPVVGPLPPQDVREALQTPVSRQGACFTDEAMSEISRVTEGYPYFVQQWAYEAWNIAESPQINLDDIRKATESSISELDGSFFRVRFDRLTPREKEYLWALAALEQPSPRSGQVAEILDMKPQSAAPLRNGLIKKGMIYSPSHGDIAFTVPFFGQFMRRTMEKDQ